MTTQGTSVCTPSYRLLSMGQIERIHAATLEILETVGVNIGHPGARDMLAEAGGADVNPVWCGGNFADAGVGGGILRAGAAVPGGDGVLGGLVGDGVRVQRNRRLELSLVRRFIARPAIIINPIASFVIQSH